MTEWNGTWHPIADKAPMRSEEELRKMADGIAEGGQQYPCLMTPDGVGLDGRNRVAACRIAGVEPSWQVTETDPLTVIRECSDQRQWSTGQHAMFVALTLTGQGKRKAGQWKRGSVPEAPDIQGSLNTGAWREAMKCAGTVLDWLPDLADDVLSGDLALDAAYQKAKNERDRREADEVAEVQRRAWTAALPDDLAALVDSGVRKLADAMAESDARDVVARIDETRNGDGAPAPSFADRVQSGALTWIEARKLAEEWRDDRAESIERDHGRLIKVTDGWGSVRIVRDDPTSPYVRDLLESLSEHRRNAVQDIIRELNGDSE